MVKRCNRSLECVDIRGNLNTRISKLDQDEGEYSAIILAKAGLDRMNWSERTSCVLSPEVDGNLSDWMYAVGQGAICVECRSDDQFTLDLLKPLIHLETTYEIVAERSLMRKLEAGCSVPLGVRSSWHSSGSGAPCTLKLEAIVLSRDGADTVRSEGQVSLLGTTIKEETVANQLCHQTTGIVISKTVHNRRLIQHRLSQCSSLGQEIDSEMIRLGCLGLMKN